MAETSDGRGRLELTTFHARRAGAATEHPGNPSARIRSHDFDADVARLRAHGAELVREVEPTKIALGSANSAARRGSSRPPVDGKNRWIPAAGQSCEEVCVRAEL